MFKIPAPNYTQTPNDLFDHWLPFLKEGELKVLMVIMRKTFGFHKDSDKISISQLMHYTGLSEATVLSSIKSLIQMGLVRKETVGKTGMQESHYQLIVEDSNNSNPPKFQGGSDSKNLDPPKFQGGTPPNFEEGPPQILGDTKETSKEMVQNKQQATPESAAAPVKSNDDDKLKSSQVYESLYAVDIPLEDKLQISRSYPAESIDHALSWVFSTEKPIQCLAAAIKWACKSKPTLKNQPNGQEAANKQYAMKYDNKKCNGYIILACNEHVEIAHASASVPFTIKYSENGFKEQLHSSLRKRNLQVLET